MTSYYLRLFLRLSYPVYLLIGVVMYFMGVGIAVFLGEFVDWNIFWLGLLWILFLLASGQYLNAYFAEIPALGVRFNSPIRGAAELIGPEALPRPAILWAAYISLAITASITVLIISSSQLNPVSLVVLLLLVSGVFFIAVPPFRQITFSYHELLLSAWMAGLIPAFGFLLQAGEFHRLIAMTTFPLVAAHVAMVLIYSLEDFSLDLKYEIPSFLARIGWQEGMNLHNFLIIGAYILVLAAMVFGLPVAIGLPILVTLPVGGFQVWSMLTVSRGAKPNWRSLEISAIALFLAMSYLTTYGFWTR
jgi:1,4-dihydroxy-2-naphthoate octaprenyltransferase